MPRPRLLRPTLPSSPSPLTHRFLSHKPAPTTTSTPKRTSKPTPHERLQRLLTKLPKPLHRYTTPLQNAPATSIIIFLVLHEITAVVPLVGLAGFFHWSGWVPGEGIVGHERVQVGVERFGRYFERKGWFGFGEEESDGMRVEKEGDNAAVVEVAAGSPGRRILLEVAMAYAITKVLLPVRILGSVWATPVVVGWLGRLRTVVGRKG